MKGETCLWWACMGALQVLRAANSGNPPPPHPSAHHMIEPPSQLPPSATSLEMEDFEDWELLSNNGSPAHDGKPPQGPPFPAGPELVAQKNPDGDFAMEIEVGSPGAPADPEGPPPVFLRKLGEVEFADMKVGAPSKSHLANGGKPLVGGRCEDKGEEEEGEGRALAGQEGGKEKSSEVEKGFWEAFGFGALCSMGVAAAATICLLIVGGRHQQKHHQQNQELHFQIGHDEKSMKQVMKQATTLNQAISVVKAVPMSRAHLSFGGHYDLL